jgi:NAD+ diphosphatase
VSEPNSFTGATLDRAADGRRTDDAWVAAQRTHPNARMLVARDEGVAAENGALRLQPLSPGAGAQVLLGLDADGPVWAVDEQPPPPAAARPTLIGAGGRRGEPAPRAPGWISLREAAGSLSQAEGGLAGYAAALLNWHRSHRFCANCGAETAPDEAGLARTCARCGSQHHPRTDPVVIMLVTGPDRVLLGRQPTWPARRYSALAGFVGPGESLEEAVAREVFEEAGVEVAEPDYVSSQPWPFPASLMLGFEVRWTGGEPGGTDPELQDVRWFDREQIADAALRNAEWEHEELEAEVQLPPRSAIARRLIDGWLERG